MWVFVCLVNRQVHDVNMLIIILFLLCYIHQKNSVEHFICDVGWL